MVRPQVAYENARSLVHLLSRNGFLPAPVGAIAAAAVFVLFAMTDSSNGPVSSASSNLSLVVVDSSNALDSIAMRAQLGLGIEDSLLYRVNADVRSEMNLKG